MQNDKKLIISEGQSRKAMNWKAMELYWSEFIKRLSVPHRSTETLAEYKRLPKTRQDELKDVGGFVGGQLSGSRRKSGNVISRSLVTLDLDNIPAGQTDDILKRVEALGCAYVVYSTRKHESAAPRLRVIMPPERDLTADEYEPVARKLASLIGIEFCDPTTFDISRLMYWPSCCRDSEWVFTYGDKGFVSADGILGMYEDRHNVAEWPAVPGETERLERNRKRQEDPTTKKGIIGAFCRVYDVPAAMDKFLPGIYEETSISGRYTYTAGSTVGGAVLYDDGKFLYSHHATDPAQGRLCNSFDLVRLHKFGYLDEEAKPETPIAKLPSTKAMSEFASQDEPTCSENTRAKFKDKTPYPDVQYGANGSIKVLPTCDNLKVLLENEGIRVTYDMILREVKVQCEDKEKLKQFNTPPNGYNNLLVHCADQFVRDGLRVSTAKIHEWVLKVADDNRMNAASRYLEVNYMIWGGVAGEIDRLFECFTVDGDAVLCKTLLTKWLCQCVAMAYNNEGSYGADGVLVLKGPHGIGKTTFFRKCCVIGQVYFAEGVQIDGSKDKLIESTASWIGELGELPRSLKDMEYMKNFITCAADEFRTPYAKKAEYYPRLTSFGATTNSESFLKEDTERRFRVIEVKDINLVRLNNISFEKVWAEAYGIYKSLGDWSFRLTREETEAMQTANREYLVMSDEESLLRDKLDWTQSREQWKERTASAICDLVAAGRKASPVNMGRALRRIGYSKESEEFPVRVKDGRPVYLVPTKVILPYEVITEGSIE